MTRRPPAPDRRPAIVIFGATGDLALRMLFPSLYFLELDGLLSPNLQIVGSARTDLGDEPFADRLKAAVLERTGGALDPDAWARLEQRLHYAAVDGKTGEGFDRLAEILSNTDDITYYLSTSPSLYGAICSHLKAEGLAHANSRIVVEKPIGRDLASCREINDSLAATFSEDRIFRIDHYLGKEAVQNLLALRFANTLFEPLWNKVSIEHVQITVAEAVGVEGRWSYYNDYGAIRDMVQNHLLQLLCLVAMEPPASLDPDSVRNEKVKVLRSLRPIKAGDVDRLTVRGQYTAGLSDSRPAPAYADEAGGGASSTETYVALSAFVDNWRWAGVPFYLRTGKRLPVRSSQIVIQFRPVPHSVFDGVELLPNRLTIRLQPEENISLTLMNKTPSLADGGMELKPLALNLSLDTAFKESRRRIAYERLLLEALNNNQTLFVRRDEAEAAWTWIDQIIDGWNNTSALPKEYTAGSWGPSDAFILVGMNGHNWYD